MDRLIISELSYKNISKIELINKKNLEVPGDVLHFVPFPLFLRTKENNSILRSEKISRKFWESVLIWGKCRIWL